MINHSSLPFKFKEQDRNYYNNVTFYKDFGKIKSGDCFSFIEINYLGGFFNSYPHIRCVNDRNEQIVEKIQIILSLSKN